LSGKLLKILLIKFNHFGGSDKEKAINGVTFDKESISSIYVKSFCFVLSVTINLEPNKADDYMKDINPRKCRRERNYKDFNEFTSYFE